MMELDGRSVTADELARLALDNYGHFTTMREQAAPAGPGQSVADGVDGVGHEFGEQAADFVDGQGNQPWTTHTDNGLACWRRTPMLPSWRKRPPRRPGSNSG
jgi:hypothetical protein